MTVSSLPDMNRLRQPTNNTMECRNDDDDDIFGKPQSNSGPTKSHGRASRFRLQEVLRNEEMKACRKITQFMKISKPIGVIRKPESKMFAGLEGNGMGEGDSPSPKRQYGNETSDNFAPGMEAAGEIVPVELSLIRRNPDNPNYHTPDQVQLLARNIRLYALRNPVELKKVTEDKNHQYEIIAGEGRFWLIATCKTRKARTNGTTFRLSCDEAADPGTTCGTRLSENALRWFNWAAGCVEVASLKPGGANLKTQSLIWNKYGLRIPSITYHFVVNPGISSGYRAPTF